MAPTPSGCHFPLALFASIFIMFFQVNLKQTQALDRYPQNEEVLFKEVEQIVRMKGFETKEHIITTSDGYLISLVECWNPLIASNGTQDDEKEILMFIHGTLTSSNIWVVNSHGVKPRDYSKYDVASMTEEDLNDLIADDPARNNLPMLAMQFNHRVWFLNRRGSVQSRRRVNNRNPKVEKVAGGTRGLENLVSTALGDLTSPLGIITKPITFVGSLLVKIIQSITIFINGDFWEYSLDEQATYDIPEAIDYILRVSKRDKLSVIGHSTGGALILMTLADKPQVARKVSHAFLWAPAANLGHSLQEIAKIAIGPVLGPFVGPLPPLIAEPILQGSFATICTRYVIENPLCLMASNLIYGRGGKDYRIFGGLLSAFPKSVASRELAHLSQSLQLNGTHKYNFANKADNIAHYGQENPPEYNFSAIELERMHIVTGETDGLVGPKDVDSIVRQLRVPVDVRILESGGGWNHGSYYADFTASRVIMVPTLKQLYQ